MGAFKRKIGKIVRFFLNRIMGSGLMQDENTPVGERYVTPGMRELARQAAAESAVLLKNEGVLPLDPGREIAVFGRCQMDWFFVGYGSGGDVHPARKVSLMDALRETEVKFNKTVADTYLEWTQNKKNAADQGFWGQWPYSHPEMHVSEEFVKNARNTSDTAVIVIGRAAGEDRENVLKKGSFYLTDAERELLDRVTDAFERTVVILNVGSIMDLSWTKEYGDRLSAILLVWLGGMESGNAVCDVLYGRVSPSGRLPDTVAYRYEDYPSSSNFGGKKFNHYAEGIFTGYRHFDRHPADVLYPFGFGLSYTTFSVEPQDFSHENGKVLARVRVRNDGLRAGKETALLWCHLPAGEMEKPVRVLVAFGKTKTLEPGEEQELLLSAEEKNFASFDESRHAFVLDQGEYRFSVNDRPAGSFTLPEEKVVERCAPLAKDSETLKQRILRRIRALEEKRNAPEKTQTGAVKRPEPQETGTASASGFPSFDSVLRGELSLDDFVESLSDPELEALTRGEGFMNSPLGVPGNAGVFGGVTESLRARKVPPVVTADGPAGLRLARFTSLLPSGTALAATFDQDLVEALLEKVGEEMGHYGVDVILSPGMNLHRNPLCGRNFEYFSEDPLLSGKIAAAEIRGIEKTGHAACPKHFACNHQEKRRNKHDSRVGERALRELYLRNFEIAVREGKPKTLMTSYNKVNGIWSHYHFDLVETVLRSEWGFDGVVITDRWMQKAKSPEFPLLRDNAYRVRAGVDVLMPGNMSRIGKTYRSDGSLLKTLDRPGGITRSELRETASRVLKLIVLLQNKKGLLKKSQ